MNSVRDSLEIVNDSMECMGLLRISFSWLLFLYGQNASLENIKKYTVIHVQQTLMQQPKMVMELYDATAKDNETKAVYEPTRNLSKLEDDETLFG